jgi:hypothetical protein
MLLYGTADLIKETIANLCSHSPSRSPHKEEPPCSKRSDL